MDDRLRRLERAFGERGAPEDGAALLTERERVGALARERLELAAHLGHPAARLALGLRADDDRLPRRLFAPDVELPLSSAAEGVHLSGRTLDADLTVALPIEGGLGADTMWVLRGLDELAACGVRRLVLHAAAVNYVSSSALSALVRTGDRLAQAGGGVALVACRRNVRLVVEMLGLDRFLRFFDDVPSAAAALPSSPPTVGEPRAWLLRLARWGREPCVRAALAALRTDDDRTTPAAVAAREWLRCPCALHRREARETLLRAGNGWDAVAATVAGVGTWPLGLTEGAPLEDEATVRAAVSAWSLGLAAG